MIEDAITALGDVSVREAIQTLYQRHIGSIVVLGKDGKCEGIFTERDAIRVVATEVPLSRPLKEVMSTNVKTVVKGTTFAEAKSIMRAHNIRHLPVTDSQGRLIGLISLRAILDEILNMQAVKR